MRNDVHPFVRPFLQKFQPTVHHPHPITTNHSTSETPSPTLYSSKPIHINDIMSRNTRNQRSRNTRNQRNRDNSRAARLNMPTGMTPNARARLSNQPVRPPLPWRVTLQGLTIDWGCRSLSLQGIRIPGQSWRARWLMVENLRRLGLFDADIFPTVFDFLSTLGGLVSADDVLYCMDSRIFSFLIKGWMKENPDEFDFILAFRIYTSLKTRLATLLDVRNPTASPRRVRYGRDLDMPSVV